MAGSNVGRVLTRRPDLRLVRGLAGSALVLNVLLVVSGGAVRLTDSGLGCPTWPRCSAGSLTVTRVGWPGGVSPPGSHGTVRDSLPSHGSSHPGSR